MCKIVRYSVLLFILTLFELVNSQVGVLEERLMSYQKCLLDSDCRENSFCFDNDNNKIGLCKCQTGYELLSRNKTFYTCLKLANWGEPCSQDNQCYDYLGTFAVCDETCKCGEGSHKYTDGKCYKSVLLTDFCNIDANCLLKDGSYGSCLDGRCDCYDLSLRPTDDKTNCVASKNIGETCASDDDCSLIPNAVCRMVCRCSAGYVMSRSDRNCIKAATKFFDPCDEDDQCSENLKGSVCNNGNCTCTDGFHGFGSVCARSVGLKEACVGPEECITDLYYSNIVNCTEGICQCQPGVINEQYGCSSSQKNMIFSFSFYLVLFILYFM